MFSLITVVVFCFSAVSSLNFIHQSKINPDLLVETSNGVLQGKTNYLRDNRKYYSYEGIPFAKPPLNELRFRAPKPFGKWTGVLDASMEASHCIELRFRNETSTTGSEDCLYLNVFTPENPRKIRNYLPVMVWIHGGAFIEGNSEKRRFGPERLLNQDVVIVTCNYRIGIFGFLSTNTLDTPGNYGLKDQNMVLKWVSKNIRRFGGNPNNVTLFGQSAGGASVMYHVQSPLSRGLFHRAIAESGSSLCTFALQIDPLDKVYQMAEALQINSKNPKEIVEQMRKMDVEKLQNAQEMTTLINFLPFRKYGIPFSPTIEPRHKRAFLTDFSYEMLNSGNFSRVPVIIGLNSQEGYAFKYFLNLLKPILNLLYDSSPGLLAMPNLKTKSFFENRIFGLSVLTRYFTGNTMTTGTFQELSDFFSDDVFYRPIRKTAELLSKYVPLYFYIFTYEGEYAANGIDDAEEREPGNKGVSHSEELWYLWNRTDVPLRGHDLLVSNRMVKMWSNFAKYGNPTPRADPLLQNIIWPTVSKIVFLKVDKELTIEDKYRDEYVTFWEEMFRKFGRRPYMTF
ncbi:juvenile hormone esterase isoform X2 [Aethina tumida]|uniref:juvenile hormone esterase isoform X2 n=1 Tax=Aethina tumida TaxID=116153 RepID=UPI002147A436|nr:juvenile hormone esterase isoform X2 [Aethina tumida]